MNILAHLPSPSNRRIALHVTPAAERTIRAGHPWLFDRALRQQSHNGAPGDLAVIFDRQRRFLAIGLYDPLSPIRVRILHQGNPLPIDVNWFRKQLTAAIQRRAPLLLTDTNGYRLVHGENDALPGLVIDRYDTTFVIRLDTVAWLPHLRNLLPLLLDLWPVTRLVLRLSRTVAAAREHLYGLYDGQILWGAPLDGSVIFCENGLRFDVDPVRGQKTGFFLDQRENRARVETLAAGKTVLNVFAYTGGFSLYAARGGATHVTSLDLSQPALDAAVRNFNLNEALPAVAACQHEVMAADAFVGLTQLDEEGRDYDLIVIDPPSFAHRQADVPGALAAYARLTRLGAALVRPGGIVVLASCSSRVSADEFFANAHQAAQETGRSLRELARTGHALDHPIGFPEGAYLKCLFASVEAAVN